MIGIATALFLLLLLGREAVAAPESKTLVSKTLESKTLETKTPRLKELVTVTSEVVRIGDLVENAGTAGAVPVFRAPDLGQTGAVQVQRITEALRPYDLSDIDTYGLSEVVV